MLSYLRAVFAATAVVVLFSGCAATKFESSWTNPEAGPLRFNKTLAVYMTSDESSRRIAEDRLVQQIGPARSAASYTLIPGAEMMDTEKAKEKVREAGFDGAVVMRVIEERQEVSYVPPTYYRSGYWGGYNSRGWRAAYDPGYLRTDKIVRVETNIYSLAEEKLIWSGVSETFDPSSTGSMVDQIATAAAAELQSRGLLAEKKK